MPDAGILCGDMLLIQQKPVSAIHPGNLVLLEELHCRFTDFFCDIRTHHSDNSDNSDNSDPGMSSAASCKGGLRVFCNSGVAHGTEEKHA